MSKINRETLLKIIQEELSKALEEDALVSKPAIASDMYRKGSKATSHSCTQCGHHKQYEKDQCSECGYSEAVEEEEQGVIKESDCGDCNTCTDCGDDSVILFKHHAGKKHHGAYMAKKQMYKVAKYAQELYYMIPDNHNLEDWMRTKLAQISDDISEVYHALDHDIYDGGLE